MNAGFNEIVLIWDVLVLSASGLIVEEIINLLVIGAVLTNVVEIFVVSCDVNVLFTTHHSSNILWLLLLILVLASLDIATCSSPGVLLMTPLSPGLATSIHHVGSSLSWDILLALMKLIADSCILHACTHKLLESIVVTINFESIGNDVLYTIVMTYDLYFVNHTELWLAAT